MEISNDIAFISFSNGAKDKVSVCAKDLSTGEVLMTYVGGPCSKGTLNLIGSRYIMAADEHRPVIYLWALNKMHPIKTIEAVGKIGCLAVSNASSICVGSVDEKLYVWMVHTGDMTRIINYHCTRITCVKFSTSSLDFVTCDKHGSVALWNATRLMSIDSELGAQPIMTFMGHSAKVTDAHLNESYLTTCSLDKSVRVWYLRTGEQYRCFDFEGAVMSVSMNPSSRYLMVGFNEARLSLVDLTQETKKSCTTFVMNSDVVCMAWTSEGAMMHGDEKGNIGLLQPNQLYSNEIFSHNASTTNILLTPFLPFGWNDPSNPIPLDITPFSKKLSGEPAHLGTPINFHQLASVTRANRITPPLHSLPQTGDCNEALNNNDDEDITDQKQIIRQQYTDILKSLLQE